jgi:hypothetical protein
MKTVKELVEWLEPILDQDLRNPDYHNDARKDILKLIAIRAKQGSEEHNPLNEEVDE